MGENPAPGPNNPHDPEGSQPQRYGQSQEQPQYGQPPYGQTPGQPPYGQSQGQPQQYGQPYPPNLYGDVKTGTTNTLAIVSLVLAFFVNVAGIITGHIALKQIKRTGEQGRGLAIGGLVVGYVSLASIILIGILMAGLALWTDNVEEQGSNGTAVSAPSTYVGAFGGTIVGSGGAALPAEVLPGDVDFSSLSMDPTKLEDLGIEASASGESVQVVVYLDFLCPHCASFEGEHGPSLQVLRDQGKISLEYRPVAFLDSHSSGTNYSTRAAEAAACVANGSPERYQDFVTDLLENQPAMNKSTPDNSELSGLAVNAGAQDIEGCLDRKDFRPLISESTDFAIGYGVVGTPTVYVDGKKWEDGSFPGFVQNILDAKK